MPRTRRRLLDRLLRQIWGSTVGAHVLEPLVALTFDDGPDPDSTPALLDLLADRGARATFFMVGWRAERHPDIVARVAAEGHAIGNHSWNHPSLPRLPSASVTEQLVRARAALAPHGDQLMRPPYGDQTLRTHRIARRLGYQPVFWTASGGDWRGDDAETIAARVSELLAPGAIVLLHDSLYTYEDPAFRDRRPTIEAVGLLIDRNPDIEFVTVPDLLRRGAPRRRYWVKTSDEVELARLGEAPATA